MTLNELQERCRLLLTDNILPFWLERMADGRGGFTGRMDGHGVIHGDAERGGILYSRILWTFSAAYRVLKDDAYLKAATDAKRYLIDKLYDNEFGGIYWSVNGDGTPAETKKQFYALGFAIYGLSEYARATGDSEALDYAVRLFRDIEKYSKDPVNGGYIEACTREWSEISDMRLSEKDLNSKKSMNTHLHILEPYTNLYRVWPDAGLLDSLKALIHIFTDRITDTADHHLGLFFDDCWKRQENGISFGHDIEASWLLEEAALVTEDSTMISRARALCSEICASAMQGFQPDGSMIYEIRPDGSEDRDRHWWVQAETVVGLLWEYRRNGDTDALTDAARCLDYIEKNLVIRDSKGGSHATEWRWSVKADGTPNTDDDIAGFWKCPYHNSRMCLEALTF